MLVVSTNPALTEGALTQISAPNHTDKFVFRFNQPIAHGSLEFEVTPYVPFNIEFFDFSTKLSIFFSSSLAEDTVYELRIKDSLLSQDNIRLLKDYKTEVEFI